LLTVLLTFSVLLVGVEAGIKDGTGGAIATTAVRALVKAGGGEA
jgi:hypothetical protein